MTELIVYVKLFGSLFVLLDLDRWNVIGSRSVMQISCAEKLQHSRDSLIDDEGKRLHRHRIWCEPSPSFKVILNIIRYI